MLMPASTATSARRSPGTRRAPTSGSPASAGVIFARRETRNSRTSARLSTVADGTCIRRAVGCPVGTPSERAFLRRPTWSALMVMSSDIGSNPRYDFTGQVAFVTGAGSGMGLATAWAFARAGAAVVLADVNGDALRSATEALTESGHQALGVICDVSDEDQVAAAVERTMATFGRL